MAVNLEHDAQLTALKNQNAAAIAVVLTGTDAIKEVGWKNLHGQNVEAVPNKKYLRLLVQGVEPALLAYQQNKIRMAFKQMRFPLGRGIKEGRRVYPVNLLLDNARSLNTNTQVRLDKDMCKAALVAQAIIGQLQGNDKTGYFSSKGFRRFIMGVRTKSKHSKKHPRVLKALKKHKKKKHKKAKRRYHKHKVRKAGRSGLKGASVKFHRGGPNL